MQSAGGATVAVVPQRSYHDTGGGPLHIMVTQAATTQIEEAHSTTNHLTNNHGNQSEAQPAQSTVSDGDGVLEPDKRAIYRHPLFPLMALLFEKCEQATQTPECPSSDSFDVDIQAFVHHQEQDRKPFFSDDPDLDGLMVKAIQVLRIHLLELEKVGELCKDFCNRYISCLKGKLQSENLLRTEMSLGPEFDVPGIAASLSPGNGGGLVTPGNGLIVPGNAQPSPGATAPSLGQGQVVSGNTVYQMIQTPQGLVAQPIQIQQSSSQLPNATPAQQAPATPMSPVIHGSTPLSQIGTPLTPDPGTPTQHSPTSLPIPHMLDIGDIDDLGGKRGSKRGVLPKNATQVMKSWLFQHIVHPYPTEDEKRTIAAQTNLTLLQVNNWFINARRRILQPMLDASNPDGAKAKKAKPQQTRPVQRFWPENLANLQSQAAANLRSSSSSQSPTSTTPSPLQSPRQPGDSGDSDGESTGECAEAADMSQHFPKSSEHIEGAGGLIVTTATPTPLPTQPQHIILPPGVAMMPDGRLVSTVDSTGLSIMAPDSLTTATAFMPMLGNPHPTIVTSATNVLSNQQLMTQHNQMQQTEATSTGVFDSEDESD